MKVQSARLATLKTRAMQSHQIFDP